MRRSNDLWTRARREPLEILCRLAGRGCFVIPQGGGGRSANAQTPADIAHALSTSRDELGKLMAIAMVCETTAHNTTIIEKGYALYLDDLVRSAQYQAMLKGPKRARLRLIIIDVVNDMMLEITRRDRGARRNIKQKAERIRMRKGDYGKVYRYVRAQLEASMQTAARDARDYLFHD
jgi:hypothetical protein